MAGQFGNLGGGSADFGNLGGQPYPVYDPGTGVLPLGNLTSPMSPSGAMPGAGAAAGMSVGDMAALAGLAQSLGLLGQQRPVTAPPTVLPARQPGQMAQLSATRQQTDASPLARSIFGG